MTIHDPRVGEGKGDLMKKLAVIAPLLILGILMAPPGPEPARGEAAGQEGF